ncbi:glycosyl hydrolase family 85-domain-containing protein [Lineolata rhizophorae]|uniref:Glycosyl hydrolase family 85-domain-containing protein n=1 Tax=Lineolata rhizophorae TaxID=578093 RepID=A0A6A6NSY1_9PEZI|nr:glycosyl hydrolase family 85-domain-containing protein [Lineolata rhizophorae]
MAACGLKDILRPIRDDLRDKLPHFLRPKDPPEPVPDLEKQREDALRGFAYFETFDQLLQWSAADVEPLQQSNTPLVPRPEITDPRLYPRSSKTPVPAKVVLIHDYSGNYHAYENVQTIGCEPERYTCQYLQFVDSLVYFSHKLVTIPPASWTNTLHRNGVKSLGTFIIERCQPETERMFTMVPSAKNANELSFLVANQLLKMAEIYGFDGWLINIEKPFPRHIWNPSTMVRFLDQLYSDMRNVLHTNAELIWYDALTVDNRINYQNKLTKKNIPFSQACSATLTNYKWKEQDALESKKMAEGNTVSSGQVVMGVDVWAQNARNKPKRVTYPSDNGGGTNTGLAVWKSATYKLSSGIFAPAWCFQHFPIPAQHRAVERAMWDGDELPSDLCCDCGTTKRHTFPAGWHAEHPITKWAREFPAGAVDFFYTDFASPFMQHDVALKYAFYDGMAAHAQVGSQSILPHFRTLEGLQQTLEHSGGDTARILYGTIDDSEPRALIWAYSQTGTPPPRYFKLRLFTLNMLADGTLRARINFLPSPWLLKADIGFYVTISGDEQRFPIKTTHARGSSHGSHVLMFPVGDKNVGSGGDRLEELGVYVHSSVFGVRNWSTPGLEDRARCMSILQISNIAITRLASQESDGELPFDIWLFDKRGEDGRRLERLTWLLRLKKGHRFDPNTRPAYQQSALTGPFAYFEVLWEDLVIGRSYAMEYVVGDKLREAVASVQGGLMRIGLVGVGFAGEKVPGVWHNPLLEL